MTTLRPLLGVLYKYWMRFAHVLGEINFLIIFSLMYGLLIGPYAIVIRLFSKGGDQGWVEKKYTKPTVELLKRQF